MQIVDKYFTPSEITREKIDFIENKIGKRNLEIKINFLNL